MKLQRLKPRTTAFVSKRALPTLATLHEEKRLRGHALQERNRRLLQQHPLCVECLKLGDEEARRLGYTVAVDEWDHTVPLWKGGVDDESNLQGLCFKHHEEKSERERIEREKHGKGLTVA